MRTIRALRILTSSLSSNSQKTLFNSPFLQRFYAVGTQPDHLPTSSTEEEDDTTSSSSVFDSSEYDMGFSLNGDSEAGKIKNPTWDEKYRDRVKSEVFKEEIKSSRIVKKSEEKKKNAAVLAMSLLDAAIRWQDKEDEDDDENKEVTVEDQKSLAVGIIGAPNAGKSALTNFMVGTKVAAVSRKTNTTTHEVLGVMTKGHTQICFFDTPGLMLKKSGFPYNDMKVRMESAWSSVGLFDVLVIIFDVDRHLKRPDSRVIRLIQRMGSQVNPNQKRVLCMNKIDLVEKKKDLLKVAEEFKDLPGYERYFMISGLKGSGVNQLTQYLMEQACFISPRFFLFF
ncbi:unnamed protein product [Coffea canephora]|uniref:Era-type G domain-containing protein n=1 Tax=Coffea canephora TaxID=49390 RepID=A0A068VCB7_COFCA|nr:unnamed protein product [Coffea canephora]